MRVPRALSSVAATGPATALVGSPILAVAAGAGDRAVFLLLAAASVPALVYRLPRAAATPRQPRKVSRSRSNRVLLGALGLLTFAGAGLFVYTAAVVEQVSGLSAFAASFGFSLNALGGLVGSRLARRHRHPGWWLSTAGPAAFATVGIAHPAAFYLGMAWWGFAFWMGVPGILQMLADRSLEPAERAGDAQGIMALGRALGPSVGGAMVDAGAFTALAVAAGSGVALAGLTVVGVQEGRDRLPPTEPLGPG